MSIGNLFSFLDKILDKLPIQNRKERILNRLDNNKKERARLLLGECNEKTQNRVSQLDAAIDYDNQLLRNL